MARCTCKRSIGEMSKCRGFQYLVRRSQIAFAVMALKEERSDLSYTSHSKCNLLEARKQAWLTECLILSADESNSLGPGPKICCQPSDPIQASF